MGALLPLLPTPANRWWYSFNAIDGQLCQQDGTQWHAENPNYDPGPPPPPRLPREVKASMVITPESNGESSLTTARKSENRFQRRKSRKEEQNHLAPSTTQQSSAVTSGSTQQLRLQGQRTYAHNPQSFSQNSGHIISQHRPTGGSAQRLVGTTPSSPSSNIRNGRGQSTDQAQTDKGYPWHRRRPRHPASQNTPTTNHS